MEKRLEREEEPPLSNLELDRKLAIEKNKRWQLIEVFFTMRESNLLGIDEEIMHRHSPLLPQKQTLLM